MNVKEEEADARLKITLFCFYRLPLDGYKACPLVRGMKAAGDPSLAGDIMNLKYQSEADIRGMQYYQ